MVCIHPPVSLPKEALCLPSATLKRTVRQRRVAPSLRSSRQRRRVQLTPLGNCFALIQWADQWICDKSQSCHPRSLSTLLFQWQGGTIAGRLIYGQAGKFTQTPTYWHRSSTWDTTLQYCQIRPCQCISLNGADSICLHRETLWTLAARTTVSHYQFFLSISDI